MDLIGGVDISFAPNSKVDACVSVIILEYPSLRVVWETYSMIKLTAPYIAGLLAFRFKDLNNIDNVSQRGSFYLGCTRKAKERASRTYATSNILCGSIFFNCFDSY